MSKKEILTKEQILRNEPRELEIPGVGLVKVKDPTKQDKIDAKLEAKENPLWNDLTDLEKDVEVNLRLGLKMLVEPQISDEEYFNSPDPVITSVLDTIMMDYGMRMAKLTDKRAKVIKAFLDQMKARRQRLSSES